MVEEFILNAEIENMDEALGICLNDLLIVMVFGKEINVMREFCLRKIIEEKFMQLVVPYNLYQHFQYSKDLWLCIYIRDVELPNLWATEMQSVTQFRYLALYVEQIKFKWISHLHDTLWEMTKLRHVNIGPFSFVWEDNDQGILEESSITMLENMKTFHTCCIPLNNMNLMFSGRLVNRHCWDVTNVVFSTLKNLSFNVVSMEEWNASKAFFPMLEKLVLKYCQNFKEITPCFVDMSTLQLIELVNYRDSLVVSTLTIKKEIEENTGCDSLQILIS
ncbi:hypothetical protein R3W88_012076 [Solanum pinnatisectum]|uniref:Late blight resistance protein n=1 Tax=Solanum pinnatisectum TaxID=50273 RepID=A0AAV9L9B1_9SOLN|nr:hypothetical protein R3W88_012076 [Solanum pinnatisectum]